MAGPDAGEPPKPSVTSPPVPPTPPPEPSGDIQLEGEPTAEELAALARAAPPTDAEALALAPAEPDTIEIVERRSIGADTLVLLRHDVALAHELADPAFCRGIDGPAVCEPGCDAACSVRRRCLLPDDPHRYCMGPTGSFAWELARLQPGASPRVVARTRIVGPVSAESADAKYELKVYDMDGDRRSEVQVKLTLHLVATVEEPYEGEIEIAAVLDGADLHPQFAVTHRVATVREDVFGSSDDAKVSWVAKDLDGDRHADLTLHGVSTAWDANPCDLDCDDDSAARPRRTRSKQVCPYEVATDRWVCPAAQLGADWLVANDGVRVIEAPTTVAAAPALPSTPE